PWQKAALPVTAAPHRLAMVEAAVVDVEGIEASGMEIERGGVSYTADTLAELQRDHPGAELYVILGSDAAAGLSTWERIDEVLDLASLVVVTRPGPGGAAPPPGWDHLVVEVPRLEVSSTDLRARFVDGRPLDWLVPEPVVHVIRRRGLYAEGQMSPSRSATP
ncbi:MAG: nicotinate-nicotinamide nucleotide adenylyltransferase, partial [Actinomycetota bacterium]|nr:nicotinate-nicotinamide nucleotide adenylyltransferase [Actinomycetota bacterium]